MPFLFIFFSSRHQNVKHRRERTQVQKIVKGSTEQADGGACSSAAIMWRPNASLVGRFCRLGMARLQILETGYASVARGHAPIIGKSEASSKDENGQALSRHPGQDDGGAQKHPSGNYVSKKESFKFIVSTLLDLKDSKEDVYGALDACVAWEQTFPIGHLKRALLILEKEQQWHRIIQVIKWMLSKGQGATYGTYKQFIHALDMDNRAEEAHMFWTKKIGSNLHSVPWSLCQYMISVYYRNNMPKNLVKLFEGLEGFDRQPSDKSVVQQVADAYEMLGSLDEKTRVLKKYNSLFTENGGHKKHKAVSFKRKKKSGRREAPSTSDGLANVVSHSGTSRLH